ncbi:hypothetical protein LTR86_002639 [Recurvomyces mirabilis]|nr:hypothetical protein LTR86_002639 [Recurvomyces mirabilis]
MAPRPLQDRTGKGVGDELFAEARRELAGATVLPFYDALERQPLRLSGPLAFEGLQNPPIVKRIADAWIAV